MYLKKLEIQGFKSFARKTVLEFQPGIIGIVGPNGSGKSNLADAIRWVLGEQSMKAIRSKKGEDVIFAGSDKKSKLGMAEVSMVFDNEDHTLPIDFPEVVITRRLFRDGESEYLINRRTIRLLDISELLAASGYGGYSYHIISQGSIDQMVIAGPAAIKQIIEEASGVKPYYVKRERSLRKLERTEENLRRVADVVAEIEPRLRSLRRQTKRAEQRELLITELRGLKRQLFAVRHRELAQQLNSISSQVMGFDRTIESLTKKAQEINAKLRASEESVTARDGAYQSLRQETRALERQKNEIAERLAIVHGQLKSQLPAGSEDSTTIEIKISELDSKILDLQSQLQYLEQSKALVSKNLSQYKKMGESVDHELISIRKKIEAAQHPIDLSGLKTEVERLYSKFQSLLYSITHLEVESDQGLLRQDAENFEITLVKLKDRVAKFAGLQPDLGSIAELSVKLEQVFSHRDKLSRELSLLDAELLAIESKHVFFFEQCRLLVAERKQLQEAIARAGSKSSDGRRSALADQEKQLTTEFKELISKIEAAERDVSVYLQTEEQDKHLLLESERNFRELQDEMVSEKDKRNLVLIEKARLESAASQLLSEAIQILGEAEGRAIINDKATHNDPGLEQKINKLAMQLETIGGIDDLTLQEHRETEERYAHLTSQSSDLGKAVADLRAIIEELDGLIKKQFETGFEKINERFTEHFRILFSGGRAHMTLLREQPQINAEAIPEAESAEKHLDVSNEDAERLTEKTNRGPAVISGIEIRAVPPGKKLSSLAALSGGERTMTAIALLTAILASFPSPFVVLDEVDAALDEANSIRFGKILGKLANRTQFVTITHNRETMRQGSLLYGVTMGDDGISKVLSIKLEKAVEMAE